MKLGVIDDAKHELRDAERHDQATQHQQHAQQRAFSGPPWHPTSPNLPAEHEPRLKLKPAVDMSQMDCGWAQNISPPGGGKRCRSAQGAYGVGVWGGLVGAVLPVKHVFCGPFDLFTPN